LFEKFMPKKIKSKVKKNILKESTTKKKVKQIKKKCYS